MGILVHHDLANAETLTSRNKRPTRPLCLSSPFYFLLSSRATFDIRSACPPTFSPPRAVTSAESCQDGSWAPAALCCRYDGGSWIRPRGAFKLSEGYGLTLLLAGRGSVDEGKDYTTEDETVVDSEQGNSTFMRWFCEYSFTLPD